MANSTGAWVSPATLMRAALFALAYYLGAKAGLALVVQPENISALWPANPVAVALVLLSPIRIWPAYVPALFAGHLLAVVPAGIMPAPAALGLGVGNAIEVFLAAWLMRRYVGAPFTFARVRDVLGLVAFAAGVSCTFSGLFAGVVVAASIPGVPYWAVWRTWAIGDAVSIIFITPVILVWTTAGAAALRDIKVWRMAEAAALFALVAATSILGFGDKVIEGRFPEFLRGVTHEALPYMLFPGLIWAALRFGPRGATAVSLAVGLFATWGTYHGYGPFASEDGPVSSQILSLQVFLPVAVLSSLLLAAVIAERKRAEEALRESELRLKAIMNNAAVEITLKDLDGRFLMVNRTFEANHNARQDELIGKTLEDIYSPEDAAVYTALERKVAETGEVIQQEVRPIRAPGIDLFLTTKFPIRSPKDEIVAIGTINTDISELGRTQDMLRQARDGLELRVRERTRELAGEVAERARAEEAVRESGERYRRTYNNTPVMLHSIDRDGRLLSVSDHWLKVLGYGRDEVIGKKVIKFMTEDSARYAANTGIPQFMTKGRCTDLPFQFVKKDGAVIDVLLSAVAERDEAGKYVRSLTVLTDITERKQAEEALRASEERFRGAVETLQEGFALYDAEDRLVLLNDEYRRLHPGAKDILVPGMHFEDLVRRNIERGTNADAIGREEEHIRERLEQHRDPKGPIVRRLTNGTWFIIKEARTPDGGIAVTETDITELKRAEEAVRESGERYRRTYNNTPVMLHSIDGNGRLLNASDHWLKVLGYERDEVIGKQATDFMTEESARYLTGTVRPEFMKTGRTTDLPLQFVKKNGQIIDVLVSAVAERDEAGKFVRSLTVLTDITERKRAEEALRDSEERFRAFIHHAPAIISFKDAEGRYLLTNRKYERLIGRTSRQVTGKTAYDVYPAREADAVMAHHRDVVEAGRAIQREYTYTRDNKVRTFLTVKFPIPDAAGNPAAVGSISVDITERKRAEDALRAGEERFRTIAENVPGNVYRRILHPDGRVAWAYLSPGLRDLMELDPDEVIAQPELLTRTLYEDDRAKWDETVQKSVETLEPYVLEYRRITPSGKVKWMRTMARPHRRENGAVIWDGVTLDITEEKEAQAQLIQASKLATLGEMASGIAHEINQPLSVIGMSAELSLMGMEEGAFDVEFVRRRLETIVEQRDRLAEIIDHMRLFSRTDEAKLESFDPAHSVAGAVRLIEKQFRATGIELEENCPAACRHVSGYPLQLEQVVLNLLTNARDAVLATSAASGNGSPAPRVRVSLVDDKRRKTVAISVADNGGGIPAPALERIFDPFFTTKTEGHGTGLGLSISYSIIDAMAGRLEARNVENGAMFEITLPVSGDRRGAKNGRAKNKKRKRKRKARTGNHAPGLPRVLVVDDEEAIVEEVAEYLGRKGYDVATAGNGREALDLHKARPVDVVVTDLLMPVMDGAELIRRLHKSDPDLPIVVVTGHTTFGDDQEIVADGALVVLKKPILLRDLSDSLKGLRRR